MDAREVPAFLLNHVPGALNPGTQVRKVHGQPGDAHPDGAEGEVISSISHDGTIGYFVEFGGTGNVTFIVESKLEVPFE